MRFNRVPYPWGCLPTAFSCLLDMPVEEFIALLPHDGSEIIRPDLREPDCRRGWHTQEMIEACLQLPERRAVVAIEAQPASRALRDSQPFLLYSQEEAQQRLKRHMVRDGVLTGLNCKGRPHAVVWHQHQIYDPAVGRVIPSRSFAIQVFYQIFKIS